MFADKYVLARQMGCGGFGTVYKCYNKMTSRPYVVKKVPDDKVKGRAICKNTGMLLPMEIIIWRDLEHDRIVKFEEYFFEDNIWLMVMEYCSGYRDLFNYLNKRRNSPINERSSARVLKQVIEAVLFLRRKKIDHRDIKDENILFNPATSDIKLIDFGSATPISNEGYTTLRGTDIYTPPEWFTDGKYLSAPGMVWSIGCLAFVLLNGDSPFKTPAEIREHKAVTWRASVSSAAHKFVRRCLRKSAMEREPLNLLLQSSWLKSA